MDWAGALSCRGETVGIQHPQILVVTHLLNCKYSGEDADN